MVLMACLAVSALRHMPAEGEISVDAWHSAVPLEASKSNRTSVELLGPWEPFWSIRSSAFFPGFPTLRSRTRLSEAAHQISHTEQSSAHERAHLATNGNRATKNAFLPHLQAL